MGAERESRDHAGHGEPARQGADKVPAAPVPGLPLAAAGPEAGGGLLANPLLQGRGNGPVRQALLLQLQRTQGNRAAQRLWHAARPPAPAPPVVQRLRLRYKEGQWVVPLPTDSNYHETRTCTIPTLLNILRDLEAQADGAHLRDQILGELPEFAAFYQVFLTLPPKDRKECTYYIQDQEALILRRATVPELWTWLRTFCAGRKILLPGLGPQPPAQAPPPEPSKPAQPPSQSPAPASTPPAPLLARPQVMPVGGLADTATAGDFAAFEKTCRVPLPALRGSAYAKLLQPGEIDATELPLRAFLALGAKIDPVIGRQIEEYDSLRDGPHKRDLLQGLIERILGTIERGLREEGGQRLLGHTRADDLEHVEEALGGPLVDINARDARGWTPLHHAVDTGNIITALRLLHEGADPRAATATGATPLHLAVRQSLEYLTALLAEASRPVDLPDAAGNTPLHYAVLYKAPPKIVSTLLGYGANSRHRNNWGKTPYDLAVDGNQKDLAALLTKEAEEYEEALGRYLFNDPAVNEAVARLLKQAEALILYTLERTGQPVTPEDTDAALARHLGTEDATKGGAVGTDPAVLRAVIANGNLRERMTAVNLFAASASPAMFDALADYEELQRLEAELEDYLPPERGKKEEELAPKAAKLASLNLNWKELTARRPKEGVTNSAEQKLSYVVYSTEEPIAFQNATRTARTGKVSSDRKPGDLQGVALSERELALLKKYFATQGRLPDQIADYLLPWVEGGSSTEIVEHPWTQQILKQGIPLLSGPSGTVERFIQLAKVMNMDIKQMVLACLAWMLPGSGNDHSFYEMISVLAPHLREYQFDLEADAPEETGAPEAETAPAEASLVVAPEAQKPPAEATLAQSPEAQKPPAEATLAQAPEAEDPDAKKPWIELLDEKKVPKGLRTKWTEQKSRFKLSEKAVVQVNTPGLNWTITDGGRNYLVRKEGDGAALSIYLENLPTTPGRTISYQQGLGALLDAKTIKKIARDMGRLLFNLPLDGELVKTLNSKKIPDTLQEKLTAQQKPLSPKAVLQVEVASFLWRIVDAKQIYALSKESAKEGEGAPEGGPEGGPEGAKATEKLYVYDISKGVPSYAKSRGEQSGDTGIGKSKSLKVRANNETYQLYVEFSAQPPALHIISFDGSGPLNLAALAEEAGAVKAGAVLGLIERLGQLGAQIKALALAARRQKGAEQVATLAAITGDLTTAGALLPQIFGGLYDADKDGDTGALDFYKGVHFGPKLEAADYAAKRARQKPLAPTDTPAVRELVEGLPAKAMPASGQPATGAPAPPRMSEADARALVLKTMRDLRKPEPYKYGDVTYKNKLDAMLDLYVKTLKVLKTDLQGQGDERKTLPWADKKLGYTTLPILSTSKNPKQAVIYALGEKKSRRRTEGVVGQVYVYVMPRKDLKSEDESRPFAIDVYQNNMANKYKTDAHKQTESEVAFMGYVPESYLVGIIEVRASDSDDKTAIAEQAKRIATEAAQKHGGLKRWIHTH